jgi:lipopolysaccharide/colanic/teichoic acid biosynthesis glycosyltransferase
MTPEKVLEVSRQTPVVKTLDVTQEVVESVKSALVNSNIRPNNHIGYEAFKRVTDIILSLIAIVCLSPLLIGVCIAIYAEDKGSPIFSQTRITKGGKTFKMYKFRSMCMNAEERLKEVEHLNESKGGVIFKMKDDPRITKVGKFIRKTSIDELPQLFNILAGDMSIVGPRPPIVKEVTQYTTYQMNRFLVKGGLTCFWQCGGRSNIGFEEQVEMDLDYIKTRSTLVDMKIVLKTIKTVLRMDGAE